MSSDDNIEAQKEFIRKTYDRIEFKDGQCQICKREKSLACYPNFDVRRNFLGYHWWCYLCFRRQIIDFLNLVDIVKKGQDKDQIEMYKFFRDKMVEREIAFEVKFFPRRCMNCETEEKSPGPVEDYDLYVLPLEANQRICQSCFVPIQKDETKFKELVAKLAKENNYSEFCSEALNRL